MLMLGTKFKKKNVYFPRVGKGRSGLRVVISYARISWNFGFCTREKSFWKILSTRFEC